MAPQYLRARTYDNTTGRMMQYDTYQGGLNPLSRNHYTYAHNNPVNLEDPSGNCMGVCSTVTIISIFVVKYVAKKVIKKTATPIQIVELEYVVQKEYDRYKNSYKSVNKRTFFGYNLQMQEELRIHSTTLHMFYRELELPYSSIYERQKMHNILTIENRDIFAGTKEDQRLGERSAKADFKKELEYLTNLLYEKNNIKKSSPGYNNQTPSPKEEPYWVPVYKSNGANSIKYT